MDDSNVISLRHARRRLRARETKPHPITGHNAALIPFPIQIGAKLLAGNADSVFNRGAVLRRKRSKAAKPMANSSGGHAGGGGDEVDQFSALPNGEGGHHVSKAHGAERYIAYPKDTRGIVDADTAVRIIAKMKPNDAAAKPNLPPWITVIRTRMTQLGLTQADLMPLLGVSTRGAVGHYLTGRRTLSAEQLKVMSERLGVSLDKMMSGELERNTLTLDEVEERGGLLSKRSVVNWAESVDNAGVSDLEETKGNIYRSAMKMVPVVGTASLGMDGFWTDLGYPPGHGDGDFEFPTIDPHAYVLQVKGGSMHPAIRSGWYVVIEPSTEPHPGEFVLIKLVDGRNTVKELLWHRDGEWVLNAVGNGERMIIPEEQVEAVHHVAGILPPSGRRF